MGNCGGNTVATVRNKKDSIHENSKSHSKKKLIRKKKQKKKSELAESFTSGAPRRHSLPGSMIGRLADGLKGGKHGLDEDVQREIAKYTFFRSNVPESEPDRKIKALDHGQAQKQGKRSYMEDRTVCSKCSSSACIGHLDAGFLASFMIRTATIKWSTEKKNYLRALLNRMIF